MLIWEDSVLRTRIVACLLAVAGLLLGLVSAVPAPARAMTAGHAPSVHPTRLVPPVRPSLRVIHVRHAKVVRARGRVVRARVAPWPRSAWTRAAADSRPPGTRHQSPIQLTAFAAGSGGDVEYPVPTASSSPVGVAVTPDDSAWFTEVGANKVGRVTEGGSFTEYPLPGGAFGGSPLGITAGADGNLWFADDGNIGRITPSGAITFFALPPFADAQETTRGPDGNVWFTAPGGFGSFVGYVTPAGAVTTFEVNTSGASLEGITAGPDGAMWFTDAQNDLIERITTGGALTQFQMPSTSELAGITTGPDGRLWFADNSAIGAMTTSGSYTLYQIPPATATYTSGNNIVADRTTGALVFVAVNAIGQITTGGLLSFTPTVGSNVGSSHIGWAPDGTVWYTDVSGNALGMLPPGPAQFPPGVPAAQTYGCAPCALAAQPEASRGDPVNTATGAYSDTATDANLPGPGVTFGFTRAYTSLVTAACPLGPGWTDPYQAGLSFDGSGNATFTSGDGQQMVFTKNANGSFTGAPGVYPALTAISGGYQIVTPGGTHLAFSTAGQLTSMTDRSGTGLTMTYTGSQLTSVKDAGGRVVTLAYTSGLLTKLTMPDARTVTYAYTSGRLTSVTGMRGGVTRYGYNSAGQLTTITDPNAKVVLTNAYNAAGRVTSQTNADGKITTFGWNAATQTATTTQPDGGVITDVYNANVLLRQTSPLGGVTYYGYDSNLDLTQVTDPLGNVTTMTYDAHGNMLSKTDPAPLYYTQTWTYNSMNEVLTHTDGRGNITTSAYTTAGLLSSVTDPAGDQASYTYFPDGQVKTATNPDLKTTSYTYDTADNLATTTDPAGNITTDGYDSDGRLTAVKDPLGNTTTYAYDKTDDLTSVTDPLGHATSYRYDADGNRTTVTNALGKITTYAYDPAGHLTSVTDPLTHTTSYTYDGDGNTATITDPDGNTTTSHYDLADDLTSVTRPDTTTLSYTYDLDQHQTSSTNAAGNTTTYIYDPLGRVTSVTDPLGRLTSSAYDPDGNLVTVTSPDALVTTSTYNNANRLTAVSYSDGTTHAAGYGYDPAGNRTSMTDATGSTAYTYDNDGRLTKVTNGAGQAISYGYNLDSSITTVTYPNGKNVTDGYDTAQRLTSLTDWNTSKTTFGYNSDNVLTSAVYPNGITATTGLNTADQVTSITDTTASGTLASFTYTRGKDAELASTTTAGTAISAPAQTYTYNPLLQLTAVNTTSESYDKAGDPTTLGGTTQTFDTASQLTASTPATGAATTYSYNPRGDRVSATTSSATTSYGYNQASQLTSYTPPAGTPTSYTYNGDGLRATKTTGTTTATYAWNINTSIPTLLTDGTTSYLYGPAGLPIEQISSAGTPTYLLHDQLGSTRLLTSSAGAVTATYTYDAYGNTTSHTGTATTPLLYAGQYQDTETGFYYLRNRYYDPATSQFLTLDPLVAQTQAPFAYASDNPLNNTDPTGLGIAPGAPLPSLQDIEGSAACEGSSNAGVIFLLILADFLQGDVDPFTDELTIYAIGDDIGSAAEETGSAGTQIFRGVSETHHAYGAALRGVAEPGDPLGNADALLHNLGETESSRLVSFSTDRVISEGFAGKNGVILQTTLEDLAARGITPIPSPDLYYESELLFEGPISGLGVVAP